VSIRFLADADLNQAIVTRVLDREPAIDFLTANEAHLEGQCDPDVLEFAANQNRILVSHDTSTIPVYFSERILSGKVSPGVFLIHQRAHVGQVVEAILLAWSASNPEDWRAQIHYLPSFARHAFR
jgi:hypothetical protein